MRCFLENLVFGVWGRVFAYHFTDTGVQRTWECLPVTAQHAVEGSGSNQKPP